jgi:hypothetical protein
LLETNSDYLWWSPDAFGLLWKNEEARALTSEENRSEDPAKPRISNRQLSVDSGTLLRSVFKTAMADLVRTTGGTSTPPKA